MDSEFLWVFVNHWFGDSSSRTRISSKPITPKTTEYEDRSDDEKRRTSEPLIRKWFWTVSPPWNRCASNRYKDGRNAHAYLEQELKSFPHLDGHPMRVFSHKTILGRTNLTRDLKCLHCCHSVTCTKSLVNAETGEVGPSTQVTGLHNKSGTASWPGISETFRGDRRSLC